MKKRVKGSITVFLLLITTVFVTLITTLIDIIRVDAAMGVATRAGYLYNESADRMTDSEILLKYGFYVGREDMSRDGLVTLFYSLADENLDCSAQTDISTKSFSVHTSLFGRSADGMKNDVSDIIYRVCEIASNENTADDYRKVYEILDKMKSPAELLSVNMELLPIESSDSETFYSKIEKLCLSDTAFKSPSPALTKLYCDRYSLRCEVSWTQEEWDYQNSYNPYVLDKITENIVSINRANDDIVKNIWFSKSDGMVVLSSGDFDYFTNDLTVYLLKHFDTFYGNGGSKRFNAQLEYIQFGKPSDKENVVCMLEKIYNYRYAMNLLSLTSDGKLSADAAVCIAEKEAALDVMLLAKGKSVPIIKSANHFMCNEDTTDEQLIAMSNAAKSYSGSDSVSYKDYVVFGLYHSTNFEMLYARIIDLISFEENTNLANRICTAEVEWEYRVKFTPVSVVGMLGFIGTDSKERIPLV